MDTLKQPAMIVSGINMVGLIAVIIYFHKKNAALQEELNRMDDDLQKAVQALPHLGGITSNNQQQLEGIKNYLQKLQKTSKKRNTSFQDLKTLVETLVDDLGGLGDSLQNVQQFLSEKHDYKGDMGKIRKNKKRVAFSLKGKRRDDSSSESEESEEESSSEEEEKKKKKKGKKGKEKGGKKSKGKKEDESDESDDDIESAIAAVRGAKT